MKILTLKRLFVLAAIGGVVYVHKQRGGDWSLISIRDTARHLLTVAANKLDAMNRDARRMQERAAGVDAPAARSRIPGERVPAMHADVAHGNEPIR